MRPHICITVLTVNERHGWIHPELADWMIYLAQAFPRAYRVTFRRIHNIKPYEYARTAAVQQFINDNHAIEAAMDEAAIKTDETADLPTMAEVLSDFSLLGTARPYTHLLMIDNDTVPFFLGKFLDLPALALLDKDVIGAPCPINRDDRNQLNVYMELTAAQKTEPRDEYRLRNINPEEMQRADAAGGLLQVDRVGFGACLIARRVLETLEYPFSFAPTFEQLGKEAERISAGWPLGEDIRFCQNATAAGFEIWTHYGYLCGHSHEINLLRNMVTRTEFEQMLAGNPKTADRVKQTRVNIDPAALKAAGEAAGRAAADEMEKVQPGMSANAKREAADEIEKLLQPQAPAPLPADAFAPARPTPPNLVGVLKARFPRFFGGEVIDDSKSH